jgi:hypothetical protein
MLEGAAHQWCHRSPADLIEPVVEIEKVDRVWRKVDRTRFGGQGRHQ